MMILFSIMAHITKVAVVVMGSVVFSSMVDLLIMIDRTCIEVFLIMWVQLMCLVHLMQLGVVDIVMLDSMNSRVLQIMEELVKLVLDRLHHTRALVLLYIVVVATGTLIWVVRQKVMATTHVVVSDMLKLKVTFIRVLRSVRVNVVMPEVGLPIRMPVIRAVFDSMGVVVLIYMLWVMLSIVKVRVIVAKVMVTFWFDIMVLAVLFPSEMSFIVKMRYMVLQLPIALLEVSIRVVLVAMHKLSHVWHIVLVSMLIGSHLVVDVILSCKV